MRKDVVAVGLALLTWLVLWSVVMVNVADAGHSGGVPACEEDELVAGRGNFEHGKWSRYVCVHPDDITSETIENDYRNPAVYATVVGSVCEHPRFWNREAGIRASVSETCD